MEDEWKRIGELASGIVSNLQVQLEEEKRKTDQASKKLQKSIDKLKEAAE
ncbi:MAG: hypothetical protein N4A65_00480 [Cohaesibacter sp.]|jgi:hypothetical protein|nr:hypothetical protein [Cohaesibacter sp.]